MFTGSPETLTGGSERPAAIIVSLLLTCPPLALLFFPFFVSFRRLYINTLVSLFVQGNNSASFIAPQI